MAFIKKKPVIKRKMKADDYEKFIKIIEIVRLYNTSTSLSAKYAMERISDVINGISF